MTEGREKTDRTEAQPGSKGACFVCPLAFVAMGAGAARERVLDVFPPEFVDHAAAARREVLLAIKSLVDGAIDSQDRYMEAYHQGRRERAARQRGPQKVAVE
jgi:hypothetical protein